MWLFFVELIAIIIFSLDDDDDDEIPSPFFNISSNIGTDISTDDGDDDDDDDDDDDRFTRIILSNSLMSLL